MRPWRACASRSASCQNYEHGFYAAHREIAGRELDFVLFVGDYIYEGSGRTPSCAGTARRCRTTLEGYRARHALYKRDADLQAAHAAHPWILTWDDHEVVNDYADDRDPAYADPALFLRAPRRRLPRLLRAHAAARCRRRARRCASTTASPGAGWPSSGRWIAASTAATMPAPIRRMMRPRVVIGCAELADPARTMLGAEQSRWLAQGLAASGGSGSCSASPRR